MKAFTAILIASLFSINLLAQKSTKINKYAGGLEIDFGHSFPNIDEVQSRWKATFFPSAALTGLFINRINQLDWDLHFML